MKDRINGVRYNQESALVVGRKITSQWTALLCKTPRSSHYFLSGRGNRMTIFWNPETATNGTSTKIIPMNECQACKWALLYLKLSPEKLKHWFPNCY